MKILITGAKGFIGKNLTFQLNEVGGFSLIPFTKEDSLKSLQEKINQSDAIIHLAGVNRPKNESEFNKINVGLTEFICKELKASNKKIPILLSSSTQAKLDNEYGRSKYLAEKILEKLSLEMDNPAGIYQLPGVFGRWCKPNYNSVVATFCHNIAKDIPIRIDDPNSMLRLVYIDDVTSEIIKWLKSNLTGFTKRDVKPEYSVSLGELVEQIDNFKKSNNKICYGKSDKNFTRALYTTYMSYLTPDDFSLLK